MISWFLWLVAVVLLFLSLWIVLPPPTFFWLQLAVGAPEVSPWLGFVGAIALALSFLLPHKHKRSWFRPLVIVLLASLMLSSLPLLQQPSAVRQANQSMAMAFGDESVAIDPQFSTYAPFNGLNFIRGFPQQQVRHIDPVQFAAPDGEALHLEVYQPPMSGQYPAVVMLYGGGWSRGDSSANEEFGRFLAARGYVVVALEYRLTPEYVFPAQLRDVEAGLAFVRDRADEYDIDADRIALVGWSAGAHLAMLTGFQGAAGVKSIVDFYGPVDLAAGYADPPVPDPLDVRQVLRAFLGGSPSELPEAYVAASPITYVKAAEASSLPPTLLVYGGRDSIVEQKYGRFLYEQLLASGNTAVWVPIPWAEHAFDAVFNGVSNQMALHFVERFLAQTV
ncbi:MAG: alpha/beta hydrolase [Cyanobacteria bacterium P01_D01_bin.105]